MALEKIAAQLNVSEPELAALEQLSTEQQLLLSEQLLNAKVLQHKHVKNAFLQAVEQLPRLMRKPVLKMFEGIL